VYYPAPAPVRHRPSVWWWFLLPMLTLGFGACFGVFAGARRLRSRPQMYAAGGYLLVTIAYFCIGFTQPAGPKLGVVDPGSLLAIAGYPFIAVNWLGGTIHTLILQFIAVQRPEPLPSDPALAVAIQRAAVRAEARRLALTNPAMAWELRIGRPDLTGRTYDDGGLVDLNHVPAGWISLSLQLPPPLAEQIVAVRERRGGFRLADELVIYCDGMTPERLAVIRDFLLFGPR
jgi:hypothetical protein